MIINDCKRIELASGLGVKLMYCENCEVVELEIGAVSLKLSPSMIQRLANMMMKASLKLDQVSQKRAQNISPTAQFMH
jgi:hypothetical protein